MWDKLQDKHCKSTMTVTMTGNTRYMPPPLFCKIFWKRGSQKAWLPTLMTLTFTYPVAGRLAVFIPSSFSLLLRHQPLLPACLLWFCFGSMYVYLLSLSSLLMPMPPQIQNIRVRCMINYRYLEAIRLMIKAMSFRTLEGQGWVKILIKPNVTTLFDPDQTYRECTYSITSWLPLLISKN